MEDDDEVDLSDAAFEDEEDDEAFEDEDADENIPQHDHDQIVESQIMASPVASPVLDGGDFEGSLVMDSQLADDVIEIDDTPVKPCPTNEEALEDAKCKAIQNRSELEDKISELSFKLNNAKKKLTSQCFGYISFSVIAVPLNNFVYVVSICFGFIYWARNV